MHISRRMRGENDLARTASRLPAVVVDVAVAVVMTIALPSSS
jgi:hypothetical protein